MRLVTPGTLTEDSLLEARRHNFLAAFADVRGQAALAWADISTGVFSVMQITRTRLGPELARLAPSELILSEGQVEELRELVSDFDISITDLSRASFDSTAGEKRVCDLFGVTGLDAYGSFDRAEVAAMGAIVEYLNITQKGKLPLLQPPRQETHSRSVQIDAATRRNLELTQALSGGRSGSLLATIDRTVTSGGARLLERRLSGPSRTFETIQSRLDAVTYSTDNPKLETYLRDALRRVPDLDRALSRLSLDRGGPRDLTAIRSGLAEADQISTNGMTNAPDLLASVLRDLTGHGDLIDLLDQALVAEPPLLTRDGGFIAADYDEELDEARQLRDEGRGVIAAMQKEFVTKTGISRSKDQTQQCSGLLHRNHCDPCRKDAVDPPSTKSLSIVRPLPIRCGLPL